MIDKIKVYYNKIINKISESKLLSIIAMVGFWEILSGVASIVIIENKIIKMLGIVMLFIGFFVISIWATLMLTIIFNMIAKKMRNILRENSYSPAKERKRIRRIRKNNEKNERIKVAFYCDGGQFWSTFCDLYELLDTDSRFEPIVVAAPETLGNKIYHYDAVDFLEKKGIPYIKLYDNGKWMDLRKLNVDYFFYNRHYLLRQSEYASFKKAREYSKICYIPYAICPQIGEIQDILCSFEELRAFDFMFSENELMTKIYNQYKNEYSNVITKIETVGSPKFAYAIANADKDAHHNKKYVQSILYTPRWCFSDGTSSFFELKDFFFNLVKDNKEIQYIFRPHPLMKQTIVSVFGLQFWDEFIAEFDKYENADVDFNVDYMESFSRASVLISDLSTMMFEFSVTEKPVIYMYKVNKLNEFGKEASKGYYYCYNSADVDKTLKMLRTGNDRFAELRTSVSQKLYYNNGNNPAERIRDILLKDYDKK